MKIRSIIIAGFIFSLACVSCAWAQDADLRAKVEELFEMADQYTEAKDLEAHMMLFADDWQLIFAGTDREGARDYIKQLFADNDELWAGHMILDIGRFGKLIKVISDQMRKGRSGEADWVEIYHRPELHYLVQEGNHLKFLRTAEIDKDQLNYVDGQIYKDEKAGVSFTAPDNWAIIPSKHPTMQGYVMVLAPDMSSSALLGYLKIPGLALSARQAIEGDEAATEKIAKEGDYKLHNSGPVRVGGYEGFETESEFLLPTAPSRHRRRVYFKAFDFLYVLCFDAIPPDNWEVVKGGFQSILDSIQIDDPAQKAGI